MLHHENITEAGQVGMNDVINVITEGNIREKLTATAMFIDMNCYIIVKMLFMLKNGEKLLDIINVARLKEIANKMKSITGLNDDELHIFLSSCTSTQQCTFCKIAVTPSYGLHLLSRIVGFPYGNDTNLRTKRDAKDKEQYEITINDVVPELSKREISFMNLANANDITTKLPWITGQMYWKMNPQHFLNEIANKYKHYLVSGPSGATDMILQAGSLFKSFDPTLSVLSGIAWCGNAPDHSIFECLITGIPYGLQYNISMDVTLYMTKVINSYNPQGGKLYEFFIDSAGRLTTPTFGASRKKSLDTCTIAELKARAAKRGISLAGCAHKAEMIAKLRGSRGKK
jgi:hypothetical protein